MRRACHGENTWDYYLVASIERGPNEMKVSHEELVSHSDVGDVCYPVHGAENRRGGDVYLSRGTRVSV